MLDWQSGWRRDFAILVSFRSRTSPATNSALTAIPNIERCNGSSEPGSSRSSASLGAHHWSPLKACRTGPKAVTVHDMGNDGSIPPAWPRLMRARTAAAYVGERSVASFRRSVGTLWPRPLKLAGKGERWLKEDLDAAIDAITNRPLAVRDAADVL